MAKKKNATNGEQEQDDTADLLTQLVVRKLLPEIVEETNEPEALRRALLLLILATQDFVPTRLSETFASNCLAENA